MADVNTNAIDFERVNMLLDVVHKCATVGPKLTSLGNAAMTELTKVNDSVRVAAMQAKVERQKIQDQAATNLKPGDPTKSEPDQGLVNKLEPDEVVGDDEFEPEPESEPETSNPDRRI